MPSRRHFIQGSASHELHGRASFDFATGGLRATIGFPVPKPRPMRDVASLRGQVADAGENN